MALPKKNDHILHNKILAVIIIFYFLLLPRTNSFAQSKPCTQDDLLKKTGSWKKLEDYVHPGKNYTENMKPEIFNRLEKIRQILAAAYTPLGMEVSYERQIYGTPPFRSGTVTYCLWGQLLEYACDVTNNKLVLSDESDDHFFVLINHFDRFITYDTSIRVGHYYVALMPPRVGKIGETDLFQTSLVRINERFILVCHKGSLPYIPLTQKQYLVALKEKLQREESNYISRDARWAKDETQRLKNEQYWKSHIDPQIKAIDDYLAKAQEADLNQTAFVKDMQDFKRFYSEKEGGRMPIILNADYFNPAQAAFFPQFIMIVWQWNDGEGPAGGILRPTIPDMDVCCKVAKYYKESLEKNLDLAALRSMLDK